MDIGKIEIINEEIIRVRIGDGVFVMKKQLFKSSVGWLKSLVGEWL